MTTFEQEILAWKLSNARAGMLSSNSFIISHGPSPTPTNMIDRGYSLEIKTFICNGSEDMLKILQTTAGIKQHRQIIT